MAYDFNSLTKQADEASNRDKFYTDFEDVDPNKLHQITELTEWMRTKAKGSDVREVIAQLFERTWLEESKKGNANIEVAKARGRFPVLNDRLNNADKERAENARKLAQKANKDEVTNVMTPKGTLAYASLPTSGNQVGWYYYCPDGDGTHGAGNYVWNGTSWYFGGTGDEGYNLLKKDLDNYIDLFDTNILYSRGKFICNSGNGGTWKVCDETIKFYPEKKSKLFLRCGNVTGSTSDRVILFNIFDDKNKLIVGYFLTKNSVIEIPIPEDYSYCEMQFVLSRDVAIGANVDCVYENIAITVNSPNTTLSNKSKKSELNILPVSTKGNVVSKENRFISDIIDLKSEKITRNLLKVVATTCVEKATATKPGELDLYGIAFELDGHTVNSSEFYEIISSNIFTFSRERKEYYTFYTSNTNCYVTIPNVTNIEEATRWLKNNLPEFWVYLKNPITEKIEKSQLQKYTNEFVVSKTINDYYKYNYADFYKTKPPYWILHLDCARKYFSVENIKIIIDRISNAGFNQLNFHFSEDQGFRLQLGDMTIQDEDGISYDLTPCLGGYENPTKWYTQNEMDSIIEYAKSKNIDIVPSFDMPGHLGYILNKFPDFKSNDDSTIDIANATAVKFLKAILVKYLKYFSSRGCKYWNMGFDEIGENGLGFKNYYDSGNYQKIIDFSNMLVTEIKKYGFIPRMFNDGVYYHDDYNYMFDKDIEICVWKGSSTQANMGNPIKIQKCGYKVINWSGAFYWVLGNTNLSVAPEYFDDVDLLYNLTKEYWIYPTPTYGATLSIWCDGYSSVHPNDDGDYVLAETENLILAFGKAIKRATF